MLNIPLQDLAKRLTQNNWKMLEIVNSNPGIFKKELHEKFGKASPNKFDKEYQKIYASCLIDEKKDQEDTRYIRINLTKYGEELLKLNELKNNN